MSPRVLLVNDDGPPGVDSPYIFGLYHHLVNHLSERVRGATQTTPYVTNLPPEWNVRVVIPSSQKSWIGKAYHITEVTQGRYFYPKEPDGVEGETSDTPRPLKKGEIAEWILLDGTPATCTNVALHNLYPGEIDLVISGPNHGRNTSTALCLSSGTIGAAMSAALSRKRAVAISYGTVFHPTPDILHEPAHNLSVRIVEYLWTNWGKDPSGTRDGEVDLYNVNLPMIHKLADPEGLQVYWTRIWRNSYGRLFQDVPPVHGTRGEILSCDPTGTVTRADGYLAFKFAPSDWGSILNPDLSVVPIGTDGWAFAMGHASISPMRSGFAEADIQGMDEPRKVKL